MSKVISFFYSCVKELYTLFMLITLVKKSLICASCSFHCNMLFLKKGLHFFGPIEPDFCKLVVWRRSLLYSFSACLFMLFVKQIVWPLRPGSHFSLTIIAFQKLLHFDTPYTLFGKRPLPRLLLIANSN